MRERYVRFVNALSATPFGSWLVKNFSAKVDPTIFRLTNGRFMSTGAPTLPMIAVTAKGAKSGEPRTVQLAFHDDGGELLVVASAMGQERHPAWSYNLLAHPEVDVQARGEQFRARASLLDDGDKDRLWPAICETIPQMRTYEVRTDRNIKVFRLTRAS